MKKYIYIISVLFAGFLMSCEDYLNTEAESSLEDEVIYSSYDLASGAVDAIKVSFGETNSYRGRFLPWYGMNTDIEWYNSSEEQDDKADLCTYSTTSTNSQMNTTNNAWAKMYEGIERANLCIDGLRKYGNIESNDNMAYLLGEALTLRAIYYADLVKTWGDVPARFKPITTETLYLGKSSKDTIYVQLLKDLEEAAEYVPWPGESSELTNSVENINKAFVKGLRARLALNAGGYSQYPDGVRLSNTSELDRTTMYNLAYTECKEIIQKEGVYVNLEDSFEDVFRKNCEENIAAGGESLWEIPFSDGRGRMLFTFAIRHQGSDQYTAQPRGGTAGPTPTVYYDYDESDLRRDVTVTPYEWGTPVDGIAQQDLLNASKWSFGKFRYEWMTRRVTSSNDDGVNKMYMRYAEIILMAAECANELESPSAAAPYLKEVRSRAFSEVDQQEKVIDYVDAITTKEEMFNAIVDEHAFEFCGEMIRKEALIRWNLLGSKLAETKAKMTRLMNLTDEYADVPSKVYYSFVDLDQTYDDGNESLEIYGLNRGENDENVGSSYEYSTTWLDPAKTDLDLSADKIESLYYANPDENQYWPIWQVFIDSSNGKLTND